MKTFRLLRASLQGTSWFSRGGLQELKNRDQLWLLPLGGAGILVAIGSFIMMLIRNYQGILALGLQAGRPEALFFFSILGSTIFIFLISIPFGISLLYFSRDTRMLIPLPLKDFEIVAAKTLHLYLFLLPLHLLIFIPAVVVTASNLTVCPLFYINTVIQGIFIPLLPIALGVGFIVLLMKAVNISRHKTAFEVFGMLFGLMMILGFQVLLTRVMASELTGEGQAIFARLLELVNRFIDALPPLKWAAMGFFADGAGYLLLSILTSAGFLVITLLLIQRGFIKGLSARMESQSVSRVRKGKGSTILRQRSITKSLIYREWKILSSNSTFIFEAFGEVLVLPLLLLVFSFVTPGEAREGLDSLLAAIPHPELIIFGLVVLFASINAMASTSLSREGRSFALSLTLPLSSREQMKAKLLFQIVLFFPAYLLNMTILMIILKVPVGAAMFIVPGGFGFIILGFLTGISVDLRRPVLTWSHPQQAVKQNLNVLVSMGLSVVVIGAHAGIAWLLLKAGMGTTMVGFSIALLALFFAALLFPGVIGYAEKSYGGRLEI